MYFRTSSLVVLTGKYSINVMTRKQKATFFLLLGLWAACLVSFWRWWLQEEHVTTLAGFLVNSVLLMWFTGQVGWYLYFVGRMREPNPQCTIPPGRVAIIVTKAPSEPWDVVKQTLEWMLVQDFPREYDVWLADEDPSRQTYDWCFEHNVFISCRRGIDGYHNQKWPRRTKCKEGNLAFFYDRFGYDNYDFVVQLDADHVPSPSYLKEMIRPFADPDVGYVAAPSICDKNAHESWTARSRLHAEGSMHGSLQAGYHDGFAPLCIGSHYAVRTRALKEAGGLGPELAEDHSTTLLMNAAGWRGAFAFRAFAHGDGPTCLADLVTQEFQWCRSLVNILLNWTPKYWTKLPWHLKVQFGFAQLWYVFLSTSMLVGHTLPVIALISGIPWANVMLIDYYAFAFGLTLISAAVGEWVRQNGWFRPFDAKIISWEMMLFQIVRWPWTLLGVVYALIDTLTKKEFAFKVTPKGVVGARPLPTSVIAPYILIALVEAGAAILIRDAGAASGYYYLAVTCSLTYCFATLAIIGLHIRENRQWLHVPKLRLGQLLRSHRSLAHGTSPSAGRGYISFIGLVGRPLAHATVVFAIAAMALGLRWDRIVVAAIPPTAQLMLIEQKQVIQAALAQQTSLARSVISASP